MKPAPDRRRFLTAEWRHLAMLSWEVDPALLRAHVPLGTELDAWEGRTLLSAVGFHFLRTRLFGIPVPFVGSFEEVNLRFYVRARDVDGVWRRGAVFLREIVPFRSVAAVARATYGERYLALPMRSRLELPDVERGKAGNVSYRWGSAANECGISCNFAGRPALPAPGSEEEFVTEHYWGYSVQRSGSTLEYRVDHPPWEVWPATEARVEGDLTPIHGAALARALNAAPRSAFVAAGSPVVVFRGVPRSA